MTLNAWIARHARVHRPLPKGYLEALASQAFEAGVSHSRNSVDQAYYAWRTTQERRPKRRVHKKTRRTIRRTGLIKRLREHKGSVIVILVPGNAELG